MRYWRSSSMVSKVDMWSNGILKMIYPFTNVDRGHLQIFVGSANKFIDIVNVALQNGNNLVV